MAEFPTIQLRSEEFSGEPTFPVAFLWEIGNKTHERTMTGNLENHAEITLECQAYSNKFTARGAEARRIIDIVNQVMMQRGFVRFDSRPLTNIADQTIARHIGRWRGVVDPNHVTFRR